MLDKVNYFSQNNIPVSNYNYRMNSGVVREAAADTLKETKPVSKIFDWQNIEKVLEFAKKANSAKDKIIANNAEMKKFCSGTRETMRNDKIQKEKEHIAKPITDRTAYNTKQLKAAGVKDSEVKKYLTYDGHVNNEGKRILKENGKSYK